MGRLFSDTPESQCGKHPRCGDLCRLRNRTRGIAQSSRLLLQGLRTAIWLRVFVEQQDGDSRSEEHTSELQSRLHLVCRLLLEKKKQHYHQRARADAEFPSASASAKLDGEDPQDQTHLILDSELSERAQRQDSDPGSATFAQLS